MQATEGTSCLQQQCMPIKLSFLPSLVILYSDLSLFLSLPPSPGAELVVQRLQSLASGETKCSAVPLGRD